MNEVIYTYYIPKNPNILKGHIYTLYINNNKNLDLSNIITIKTTNTENTISISKQEYTKLLELNNIANQLTEKRTKDIQNFLNEEAKVITELSKINTEKQELIKKLSKEKGQEKWKME